MTARFHEALGAMLGAVAQARSLSDQLSRELALQYVRDDLLRAFPVPRTEVDSVEIELKFSPAESKETQKAVNPAVEEIVDETADQAAQAVTAAWRAGRFAASLPARRRLIGRRLDLQALHRAVHQSVSGQIRPPTLLDLSTSTARGVMVHSFDLEQVVGKLLQDLADLVEVTNATQAQKALTEVLTPVKQSHEQRVESLRSLTVIDQSQMEILFLHDDLVKVPDHVLSTLKLTVRVRNYEWHVVSEEEGEPVRKLVPQ